MSKHRPEQIAVADSIRKFWNAKGAPLHLQAAWIGNTEGETSLYPEQRGDHGKGLSITQWHWEPRGENILAATGIDVRDPRLPVEKACDAIWWEINHAIGYRNIWKALQGSTTIETDIDIIVNHYEQSANRAEDIRKRTAFAKVWAAYFGGA